MAAFPSRSSSPPASSTTPAWSWFSSIWTTVHSTFWPISVTQVPAHGGRDVDEAGRTRAGCRRLHRRAWRARSGSPGGARPNHRRRRRLRTTCPPSIATSRASARGADRRAAAPAAAAHGPTATSCRPSRRVVTIRGRARRRQHTLAHRAVDQVLRIPRSTEPQDRGGEHANHLLEHRCRPRSPHHFRQGAPDPTMNLPHHATATAVTGGFLSTATSVNARQTSASTSSGSAPHCLASRPGQPAQRGSSRPVSRSLPSSLSRARTMTAVRARSRTSREELASSARRASGQGGDGRPLNGQCQHARRPPRWNQAGGGVPFMVRSPIRSG